MKALPHFKEMKKKLKKENKQHNKYDRHLFVIDFEGDIKATGVKKLRVEIDLVLSIASPNDHILIRLNSRGGTVTGYGLVASQVQRIRQANIPLTISIDEIAASGGYLVASLANEIISAPFACIGSIGVVYEIPNLHQFLANRGIEYKQITAGKYKRTLSVFGKHTQEGENKVKEDAETTHALFKQFISQYRQLDLDDVATGETWPASIAHQKGLVDRLYTSDEFIQDHLDTHAVLVLKTPETQSLLKALRGKAMSLLHYVQ